jgi:hypothetical protein
MQGVDDEFQMILVGYVGGAARSQLPDIGIQVGTLSFT